MSFLEFKKEDTNCQWEQLLDDRLQNDTEVEVDEIDLIPIKTSCRTSKFWLAEAGVDGQHQTDVNEYKYCPFCGKPIKLSIVIDL